MRRVVVLGAGRVGKEIAKDLSSDFDVTSMDVSPAALKEAFSGTAVKYQVEDLSDPERIRQNVQPFDFVVGALPGSIGKQALEAVLLAGKNTVDISFFPEDPFDLDQLAKDQGVTAVVDIGVAPGMSNVFMGYHANQMRRVDSFECLVGGLPVERVFPFEYKAPFSPADVIEEYTRPARYVENGSLVVRPALTDPERFDFEGIGTLEALNTDGLRTLASSYDAPNMKEKTLRYPGHGRFMEALREAGFFDQAPVKVNGVEIRPLDFTAKLIFPQWTLREGQDEFTVMRVTVVGMNGSGGREKHIWDLLDRYDPETKTTSMARTTGYACSAALNLVAGGEYSRKGISPPELLGENATCFEALLAYQKARGIHYSHSIETAE
jgi:saccharopine dehydrogenase-like NADP-dependent oxidoreductase